jgi:hypothetical protein
MRFTKTLRKMMLAAAVAVPMVTLPVAQAHAGVFISVAIAPPALPVYAQPVIPGEGYIWTPGYWAYGDAGYYWVPGVWVLAPEPGLLWTPGYWGFEGGFYGWHGGYWGPHIGFYGGVNYGFGYGGIGFCGGEWRGGHFFYNSAVANFGGVHVTNVYRDTTIVHNTTIVNVNHTSFNGPGGVVRTPTAEERSFASEHHVEPTANQMQHQTAASQDRNQLASVNHGRPATPAASNVGAYHQVAQQHAATAPISSADKQAGKSFTPSSEHAASNTAQHGAEPSAHESAPASRPEAAERTQSTPASHAAPASRPAAQTHSAPAQHSAPAPKQESRGGGGHGKGR